MPEVDFDRHRVVSNRFARRIELEGIEILHDGPSTASLTELPEAEFGRAKVRRNPYARRIEAGGITLQIGRGRPRRDAEVGPTVTRSVRLPPSVWAKLEKRALTEGVAVHALLRRAILDLVKRVA
jgi:hypothetical protein